MLVSKRYDRAGTFVVDADDLARLDEILGEFGESRQYTVSLEDGFVLEVVGRENLLRDIEREHASRVIDLLATTPWDDEQRATIRLTSKGADGEPHIEYELAGRPELLFHQSMKLDRWLSAVRPWYSWISTSGLVSLVGFGLGFAAFVMIAAMFPSKGQPGAPFNPWTIPAVYGAGLVFFRGKVFPGAYFSFGPNARRTHGYIKSAQSVLLVGVGLAFLVGLAVNMVSGH